MAPDSLPFRSEIDALCELARGCAARGWVPATSGNFSVRDKATGRIHISSSGLDKGLITTADLLELDAHGHVLSGEGKPSAETGLHVVIYRDRPEAHAIAHVHSIWNTLLSARCESAGHVDIDQALRTPQFYLLWIMLCFNVTAGIAVLGVAKTMLTEIFGSALPEIVDG